MELQKCLAYLFKNEDGKSLLKTILRSDKNAIMYLSEFRELEECSVLLCLAGNNILNEDIKSNYSEFSITDYGREYFINFHR